VRIDVQGIFTLASEGSNLRVVWSEGPDAEFVGDGLDLFTCALRHPGEIWDRFRGWFLGSGSGPSATERAESAVADALQQGAREFAADHPEIVFTTGFTCAPGELRVHLIDPQEFAGNGWVTIDVPYNGLGDTSPVGRGFALNAGDQTEVLASGIAGV